LTGSRPLSTRIEPSEYSLDVLTVDWVAMVADCSGIYAGLLDTKTVSHCLCAQKSCW
jgi:hypothetical protein